MLGDQIQLLGEDLRRLRQDPRRLLQLRQHRQPLPLRCPPPRSGFIITAIEQGKRPDEVRRQSGHAANSPVFWEYVRRAVRWHDPVSRGIGL
ncbi:hypothetical protein [Streptomyces glomeratus]|uniref:Integrase n=1 Tax=Streptomyces glomeratus TaxID=284452 RepID=A0ABP6M4Q9_9ACTN|nr:hypothetical protein [Streptomyces glomeratus]MCF1512473.1 hypothetical protein [Streptomyces glomeratus]